MQKHLCSPQQHNMIRLPEVCRRLSVSRSTIYMMVAQGRFPKPVPVGLRAVAWIESEVDAWIENRIREGRNQCAA